MAARVYEDEAGVRLPSVTTIISRFKESSGLVHWAWNLGIQGKDYRAERAKAADAGTLAHIMVEHRLRGEEWPGTNEVEPEVVEKARQGFEAYLAWERITKLELRYSEVPLVSVSYRFGGTPDAVGEFDGKLILIDWKTSNSVYQDYLLQLAAYKQLWEENYPEHPIRGGFHLCRFGKETGDFAHHYYPELDEAWEAFKHMRALYDLCARLKKRAG